MRNTSSITNLVIESRNMFLNYICSLTLIHLVKDYSIKQKTVP